MDRSDSSRERVELTQTMWALAEKVGGLTTAVKTQSTRIAELPDENRVREIVDDSFKNALEIHKEICGLQRQVDETSSLVPTEFPVEKGPKRSPIVKVSVAIGAGIAGGVMYLLQALGILGK